MSNRRRKTIGQSKIREALERRLERGKRKHEAKVLRAEAKRLRGMAEAREEVSAPASLEEVLRAHGVNATPGPRGFTVSAKVEADSDAG